MRSRGVPSRTWRDAPRAITATWVAGSRQSWTSRSASRSATRSASRSASRKRVIRCYQPYHRFCESSRRRVREMAGSLAEGSSDKRGRHDRPGRIPEHANAAGESTDRSAGLATRWLCPRLLCAAERSAPPHLPPSATPQATLANVESHSWRQRVGARWVCPLIEVYHVSCLATCQAQRDRCQGGGERHRSGAAHPAARARHWYHPLQLSALAARTLQFCPELAGRFASAFNGAGHPTFRVAGMPLLAPHGGTAHGGAAHSGAAHGGTAQPSYQGHHSRLDCRHQNLQPPAAVRDLSRLFQLAHGSS